MDEESQSDDQNLSENETVHPAHPWAIDTIVVNGQPTTVTFPLEES